jgi:hypothetical protein
MPRRHAESLGTKETKETKDETSAQDALKTTTICRQESSGKLRMEVLQKKKSPIPPTGCKICLLVCFAKVRLFLVIKM